MTARALIIAIENYPKASGLVSKTLAGTNEAAAGFRAWLVSHGVAEDAIWVNTDDASFPGGPDRVRGPASQDIRDSIADLVQHGGGSTSQLFVFFSGHGFVRTDMQAGSGGPARTDVLVAADFRSLELSGVACFPLEGVQTSLRLWLGPGDHFYFVDACRNEVLSSDVIVGGLLMNLKTVGGDPSVFTLFSTQRGFAAATESGFVGHLLEGLEGRSRAKRWKGEDLIVLFDSLHEYVEGKMSGQQVDRKVEGRSEGRICSIEPIPHYRCSISVDGAGESDAFELLVDTTRARRPTASFVGPSYEFTGPPDDYWLLLGSGATRFQRDTPGPVDLYEDQQVSFRVDPFESATDTDRSRPTATASYGGTPEVSVHLVSRSDTGVRIDVDEGVREVMAGSYWMLVTDRRNGSVVSAAEVQLPERGHVNLEDVTRWVVEDRPRRSLLNQLPDDARAPDAVSFSESVGPIADQDLNVWLAIIGASRIVRDPGEWEKIGHLDMYDARAASPGDAPLYFVAALSDSETTSRRVTVRLWPEGIVAEARRVRDLEDVFEAVLPVAEGPKLLTVDIDGHPLHTTVTHCLENRATLITYTVAEEPALRQYVLPIDHLSDHLPSEVRSRLAALSTRSPLDWVRFSAQCQRAFSTHAAIDPRGRIDEAAWEALVYGKWLDPVMGVIAAYELVRAGNTSLAREAVRNLGRHYPGLADSRHLARVLGMKGPLARNPTTPPLVLEGAIGLDHASYRGMPAERLDYRGPWTSWLNVTPR